MGFFLTEDGSSLLLEDGSHLLLEGLLPPIGPALLLEDGSYLLLESGDHLLLDGASIPPIGPALLLEDGFYLLLEDGYHLLLEDGSVPPIIVIPPTRGDNLGGGSRKKRLPICDPFAKDYWEPTTQKLELERVIPPDSEAIDHISHDPRKELIVVKFKRMGGDDRPYQYHKVSPEKAAKILAAAKNPAKSIGETVNKMLINKHPFTQGNSKASPAPKPIPPQNPYLNPPKW